MTGWKFPAIRTLGLTLAATLFIDVKAPAGEEMPTTATPQPAEAGEEIVLDEVLVRGKVLQRAIIDAEEKYYELFNQLNTDDRYDTRCTDLNINPENPTSQLTSRVCIPGFVADAMVDHAEWKMRCAPEFVHFDGNRDGRISVFEAGMNVDLAFRFVDLDEDESNSLSGQEFDPWAREATMGGNCYMPPAPQLVLMEGSDAWGKHMMKITRSDPRLQDMAGHLDDLYREWWEVQRKYTSVKTADDAPPTTRHELGPRAR